MAAHFVNFVLKLINFPMQTKAPNQTLASPRFQITNQLRLMSQALHLPHEFDLDDEPNASYMSWFIVTFQMRLVYYLKLK
jgi:hypothetical protein